MSENPHKPEEPVKVNYTPTEKERAPIGQLDVLNVGKGHMKFNFNKDDEEEVKQARQVIEDMLSRGYRILVEGTTNDKNGNPRLYPVKKFNPDRDTYLIQTAEGEEEVEAKNTRATGVAPAAGG